MIISNKRMKTNYVGNNRQKYIYIYIYIHTLYFLKHQWKYFNILLYRADWTYFPRAKICEISNVESRPRSGSNCHVAGELRSRDRSCRRITLDTVVPPAATREIFKRIANRTLVIGSDIRWRFEFSVSARCMQNWSRYFAQVTCVFACDLRSEGRHAVPA